MKNILKIPIYYILIFILYGCNVPNLNPCTKCIDEETKNLVSQIMGKYAIKKYEINGKNAIDTVYKYNLNQTFNFKGLDSAQWNTDAQAKLLALHFSYEVSDSTTTKCRLNGTNCFFMDTTGFVYNRSGNFDISRSYYQKDSFNFRIKMVSIRKPEVNFYAMPLFLCYECLDSTYLYDNSPKFYWTGVFKPNGFLINKKIKTVQYTIEFVRK